MPVPLDAALAELRPLLTDPAVLVRAVASGRRRNATVPWRRVELRPVRVRAGERIQVVRYDERQAHTGNLAPGEEAVAAVDELLGLPFGNWHVETATETVQLRVTKKGEAQVHRSRSAPRAADLSHDRPKPRLLDPRAPFLHRVGITTAQGEVKPSRQDKYRQVEEFLRSLDPVLPAVVGEDDRPAEPLRALRAVDLGCGNAYLTFAAYHHLRERLAGTGREVRMVGVDVKAQARERNGAVAAELGWSDLTFLEGTILTAPLDVDPDDPATAIDVVLALHACDTATDEALARAVRWGAPVVLAAPCCHHDLQRQLRAGPPPRPYAPLTRHGILRERFADTLTDALRATLLRLLGYRVEVVEFVPSTHTPRNTLLRAVRTGAPAHADLVAEYRELTAAWGVRPHLEVLLADLLAPVLGRPGARD